ncbi:MAG: hypothetical protein ACHQ9S_07275 [Candidatus Binatia bacterium]
MGTPRALICLVALGCASCTIGAARPGLVLNAAAVQRPVTIEIDPASSREEYGFFSWLSFPFIGPWTYEVGDQFAKYAETLERQVLLPHGNATGLHLRLTLTEYHVSTGYSASCSVRATLTDSGTDTVLLDRSYAGVGSTTLQRVLWGGGFFGLGTRSALKVTTKEALDRVFTSLATDIASAVATARPVGPSR